MKKYFREFKLVEVQTTFYNIPRESTLAKWREEAPNDFEFIVKAFQGITHPITSPTWRRYRGELPGSRDGYGLLKHTDEVFWSWEQTLKICNLLKANKVLIQLPPKCTLTNEATETIREFNKADLLLIIEPRHSSWFNEEIITLFRKEDIVLCVDPFKNKPITTSKIHYWRLHGRNGYKYGYKYTEKDYEELIALINSIRDTKEVYVMFNNKYMYIDATTFRNFIRDEGLEAL